MLCNGHSLLKTSERSRKSTEVSVASCGSEQHPRLRGIQSGLRIVELADAPGLAGVACTPLVDLLKVINFVWR
jgi:hypothetical protein